MPPARADLNLYAGDDETIVFALKEEDGSPTDLTGVTARLQVKSSPCDATEILELTGTVDELGGKITFTFTDLQTTLLLGGSCSFSQNVYDVETTNLSLDTTTLLAGLVLTTADVTM